MALVRRRAKSKTSLIKSLRADDIAFSNIMTLKRATKETTGLYRVTTKKKR